MRFPALFKIVRVQKEYGHGSVLQFRAFWALMVSGAYTTKKNYMPSLEKDAETLVKKFASENPLAQSADLTVLATQLMSHFNLPTVRVDNRSVLIKQVSQRVCLCSSHCAVFVAGDGGHHVSMGRKQGEAASERVLPRFAQGSPTAFRADIDGHPHETACPCEEEWPALCACIECNGRLHHGAGAVLCGL